ncbi:unnamed protein product [Prorocentrum cordatum]|uniref:Uncharacterized protein n=1 Tax=Prorocentrum cordatum TaxID=2364126 RepID=A0ABN9SLK6_9DINO|nr:unnamed protein product [Polarella glacialis]
MRLVYSREDFKTLTRENLAVEETGFARGEVEQFREIFATALRQTQEEAMSRRPGDPWEADTARSEKVRQGFCRARPARAHGGGLLQSVGAAWPPSEDDPAAGGARWLYQQPRQRRTLHQLPGLLEADALDVGRRFCRDLRGDEPRQSRMSCRVRFGPRSLAGICDAWCYL